MTGTNTDYGLLAQMSDVAYDRNPPAYFLINSNTPNEIRTDFNLVSSDYGSASSFGAQAYYSASENRLVIAYQGSQEFTDWTVADAQILAGHITSQDDQAVRFAIRAMQMQGIPRDGNVVLTGHSLGGHLAAITAARLGLHAVAFNAPGVGGLRAEFLSLIGLADNGSHNVDYIYSENWGPASGGIHGVGVRLSDNLWFVPDTSGHGLGDLITGIGQAGVRLISLEDVQDRAVAFHAIQDARLIASQTGVSFADVVRYQLIGAINGDRQLLNSDAFKSLVGELLDEHLSDADAAHVWGEVVHETNGQCFAAGTLITMPNGTQRRIEDISVGDTVLSFDPATGVQLPRAVAKLYRGETQEWITLTYVANGAEKTLATTPEHPFLTKGGSFALFSHLISAGERWAA